MKKYPNLILAILFVVPLLIGALQGQGIQRIQRTEQFYRWLISAGEQMEGSTSIQRPKLSADDPDPKDDELFAQVSAVAQEILPAGDTDDPTKSRLVQAVINQRDADVWKMANSPEIAAILDDFYTYSKSGELQTAGRMLTAKDIWSDTGESGQANQVYEVGLTSIFFGFRKLSASLLWLQVDTYFHRGEMHRMPSLMRTCVLLDPNFIDAYLLGAWHMAYNITAKIPATPEAKKVYSERYNKRLGDKDTWYYRAADFLKDGIWNNPRDYRLYFDLGYSIYENKMKDHENAVLYLEQATRQKHDVWVRRMLHASLMKNGQFEDAIERWEAYIIEFPQNPAAPRQLKLNKGYLAEARSEEALECAQAAEDAAEEAERLLTQGVAPAEREAELRTRAADARADAERMHAISSEEDAISAAIWNEMVLLAGGDDPEAQVRLDRRQALQFREEGRYREAYEYLNLARWKSGSVWDEFSDIMIEIKKQSNAEGKPYELTLSEAKAVQRKIDAAAYLTGTEKEPIRRFDCAWIEQAGEPATP